jgi:hypothetical protein
MGDRAVAIAFSRKLLIRTFEIVAVAVGLFLSFVGGMDYARLPKKTAAQAVLPARRAYDPRAAMPPIDPPRSDEPQKPEPRAVAARAEVIRRTADAIRSECQRAAGGDWDKWQRDTAPYRADLRARVDGLKAVNHPRAFFKDITYEALPGRDEFPLFEIGSRDQLNYLYNPESLLPFRKSRAVVAADRWLRRRGIDLLFVPVPKMAEVHVEHFIDPCPPDGVVAPHARQALLELLDADVEVVDGRSLFRPVRDPSPDYLYNTCDTHWAPRGMRVMAKEIADRVVRYRFGMRARFGIPIVYTTPGHYEPPTGGLVESPGWMVLSEPQRELALRAQTTRYSQVRTHDGRPLEEDSKSPVLVIGNSYVRVFDDELARELNLRVRTLSNDNATSGFFNDFCRDPTVLSGVRVVVWVTTEHHLTLPNLMPAPITAEFDADK